jgi:hypothetical protein
VAEGWLAALYGAQAEKYLKANLAWVSLVIAVVVVALTLAYRIWARRPAAT